MSLVKRNVKGSALTASEYDAAVTEIENNISKIVVLTDFIEAVNAAKATKNGSETETFKVANATLTTHAVNKAQLDAVITAFSGALIPQGNWNASTNTPDISATTETGYYWIVSVSGSTDIGGITDWVVNDWVVKTADGWAKIDNTDKVTSVNGETGAITNVAKTDEANTFDGGQTFQSEVIFEDTVEMSGQSINSLAGLIFKKQLEEFYTELTHQIPTQNNLILLPNESGTIALIEQITKAYVEALAISASSLTGTLSDSRLSSNVVLLNNAQTITGVKTFSSAIIGNLTGNATTASNASLLNNISATNLSLGESYARIKQRYFLDNAYTVYPTDAGFQYAKLLQANLLRNSSIFILPQAIKTSLLGVEKGSDLDVVRAATATYVDENGIIQTALANVPRIDFTNRTACILVEPQRTNLLLRSQDISATSWINNNIIFGTPNSFISPDGTQNAESITTTPSALSYIRQNATQPAGIYTLSFFAKPQVGLGRIFLEAFTNNPATHYFDLDLGTVVGSGDSTFTITPYPNGWYRCTATRTFASSLSGTGSMYLAIFGSSPILTTMLFWGAQLELGSNATSYIPTVASTVTRNADVISKTGISSLLGQGQGTFMVEVAFLSNNPNPTRPIQITSGSDLNVVTILPAGAVNQIFLITSGNGATYRYLATVSDLTQSNKFLIRYGVGVLNAFINGVKYNMTLLSGSGDGIPQILSQLNFGYWWGGSGIPVQAKVKQLQTYKTALTDQECIDLTTL